MVDWWMVNVSEFNRIIVWWSTDEWLNVSVIKRIIMLLIDSRREKIHAYGVFYKAFTRHVLIMVLMII